MKKLIYILTLAVISTLTACSSDDNYTVPDSAEKNYTVNFKIQDSFLNVEESEIRSTQSKDSILLKIFVFDEKGIISNYKNDTINLNEIQNNVFDISMEFSAGKYTIAFIATKNFAYQSLSNIYMYSTSYSEVERWNSSGTEYTGLSDNRDVFYNSIEINVAENQPIQDESVSLNPMWSYLNINISDAKTFDVPEGTEAIEFDIKPRYVGFGFSDKLATKPYTLDKETDIISIESVRENSTFTYKAALSETNGDNNVSINVKYLKNDANSTIVLDTRELKIAQTTLKNGYKYNINGKLGSQNSRQSMNISLGEFNKEDVNIGF